MFIDAVVVVVVVAAIVAALVVAVIVVVVAVAAAVLVVLTELLLPWVNHVSQPRMPSKELLVVTRMWQHVGRLLMHGKYSQSDMAA